MTSPMSASSVRLQTAAHRSIETREQVLRESQRLGHIGSWFMDATGRMTWSDELYRLFGVLPGASDPTPELLIGLILPDDRPAMQAWIAACAAGEKPDALEFRIEWPDGTIRFIQGNGQAVHDADHNLIHMAGTGQDITERKQAETYREMGRNVLQALNEPGDLQHAIQHVLAIVKNRTGFEAVGIRLQSGEDFPYFSQAGFSPDFLATENTLVERGKDGGVCRDEDGHARLECTCGLVLSGKTDPSQPLFSKGGSFWANDAFPLLDIPLDQDPRHHPRNQCIHQGYASVALVPIREKDRIVGLLHLNDRRKGRCTLETIELLEGLAAHIGEALLRKQAEEMLQESEKRFRILSEHSPIGISLVRPNMTYEYVNPFFTQMFGYSLADVLDRHTWYEKAYPDPVYRERVRKAWMADFAERDGFWRMQQEPFTVRCKDGTDKIIRVNGAVLPDTRVLMTHEDVTLLVNAQNALEHLAMHDPLTGLLNRRSILERLAQEISRAKREDGRLSVGMLDIDHFKNVNDTHGHQVGDEVLIAFSKRIQASLRDYDSLGRYGGEEFLVITAAPRVRIEGNLFERLRTNVADTPIPTKAGPISVTVSIGVARGTGASTVDDLIAAADAALYQAKADGRNRVAETGAEDESVARGG